jgi:hypothetical protein
MRRVHLRGHTNILKRLVIHTGRFNLGLLMRQLIGVGTPRGLQGRLTASLTALLTLIRSCWQSLTSYKPVRAGFSTHEYRSTGRDAFVHVSVSKTGLTTGC